MCDSCISKQCTSTAVGRGSLHATFLSVSTTITVNVAKFAYRDRVRLNAPDDPRTGQMGGIVRVLENPSQSSEHQWYDVRLDDGTYGRFLEKYLEKEL